MSDAKTVLGWSKPPKINWDCEAGKLLRKLFVKIPKKPSEITVFGSACLQLCLKNDFLSADVDFFSETDYNKLINDLDLGKGQTEFYLEQPPAMTFIAAVDWRNRSYSEEVDGITVVFPHPLDILTSKVKRLEKKDLDAFFLVKNLTGHPTEDEMIKSLQGIVDMYRPNFDEENPGGDLTVNTIELWKEFFGNGIDVKKQIIIPALAERNKYYDPLSNHRKELVKELIDEDDPHHLRPPINTNEHE